MSAGGGVKGNANKQQTASQWRPFSAIFTLPLQVKLVIGPRPLSFSPSMFGFTSTMESYFGHAPNIGGHSLGCPHHKANQHTARQTKKPHVQAADTQGEAKSSSPLCSCPQQLMPASGLGWFSANLRIESVTKRDVLLACTIKQRPLVQLDLTKQTNHSQVSPSKKSTLSGFLSDKSATVKLGHQEAGLLQPAADDHQLPVSPGAKSAKLSMSRLRACRSLISLNGRRGKKKRPHIPNSLLLSGDASQSFDFHDKDGATGESLIDRLAGQLCEVQLDSSDLRRDAQSTNQEPIILVEFDCSDSQELKLARTFVEQSLPTSSIPDLVVNRMNYCQRNSSIWERQLKLANSSLSRDFDSCKRQLSSVLLTGGQTLPSGDLETSSSRLERTRAPENLARSGPASLLFIGSAAGSVADDQPRKVTSSRSHHPTANSTASSRSSSGVSSAGEHHLRRGAFPSNDTDDKQPNDSSPPSTGNSAASSLVLFSSASCSNVLTGRRTEPPEDKTHEDAAHPKRSNGSPTSSRLLRLVQKVLPASSRRARGALSNSRNVEAAEGLQSGSTTLSSSSGAGGKSPNGQQRERLMEELNGRFSRKMNGAADELPSRKSSSLASFNQDDQNEEASRSRTRQAFDKQQQQQRQRQQQRQQQQQQQQQQLATTLMNSQKVHRRLLSTGSMRHLPSELLTRIMDDELESADHSTHSTHSTHESDDDDESNDSSHLYESLERLNTGLNSAGQVGARPSSSLQLVARQLASVMNYKLKDRPLKEHRNETLLCPKRDTGQSEAEGLAASKCSRPQPIGNRAGLAVAERPKHLNGSGANLRVGTQRLKAEAQQRQRSLLNLERYSNLYPDDDDDDDEDEDEDEDEDGDEWWLHSSADLEDRPRETGGQFSKPVASWRQKLLASVGVVRASGHLQQQVQIHRLQQQQRNKRMDQGGALLSAEPVKQQRPVAIQACSDRKHDAKDAAQVRGNTNNNNNNNNNKHKRGNDSGSSCSLVSSSSSPSCSLSLASGNGELVTSAKSSGQQARESRPRSRRLTITADWPPHTQQQQQQVTFADDNDEQEQAADIGGGQDQIYVNLVELRAATSQEVAESDGATTEDEEGEQADTVKKATSAPNARLVCRMERKLAKLRGRLRQRESQSKLRGASPMATRGGGSSNGSEAGAHLKGQQEDELGSSLGWRPAHEVRARHWRSSSAVSLDDGATGPFGAPTPAQLTTSSSSSSSKSNSVSASEREMVANEKCASLTLDQWSTAVLPMVTNGNSNNEPGGNQHELEADKELLSRTPELCVGQSSPSTKPETDTSDKLADYNGDAAA